MKKKEKNKGGCVEEIKKREGKRREKKRKKGRKENKKGERVAM